MKLWVFSDLHLEFEDRRPPIVNMPDADVCVVAGDVLHNPVASLDYLSVEIAPAMPVVFVAGNHEFYGGSIDRVEVGRRFAEEARRTWQQDLYLLENDLAIVGGLRFVGATLWTDFALYGHRDVAWAMRAFEGLLTDAKAIKWRDGGEFTASRAMELHEASRDFISQALWIPFDGPTVVVTHHAPHPRSVHQKYEGSVLNASFASDLSDVIQLGRPALWVHGHVHDSFDYGVGETRIVCNPKGYHAENAAFDPRLVVEI